MELESDIFSHSNEIVKLNKSRPVYRKDDDDNLFLSQAEYYLMGWQWWMGGKPFFQAGRMDGRIVVWNGGSCPNNIRVDVSKLDFTFFLPLTEAISEGLPYLLGTRYFSLAHK